MRWFAGMGPGDSSLFSFGGPEPMVAAPDDCPSFP